MSNEVRAPRTGGSVDDVAAAARRAAAALVEPYDVIGLTVQLIEAAAHTLGAHGGGVILRRVGEQRLHVMATSSHRVEDLELFQAQLQHGPCYEAVETGAPVRAAGQELGRRWPAIADAFDRAGFRQVLATPLRWHGEVIGALSIFAATEDPVLADGLQLYADFVTLGIVNGGPVEHSDLFTRTRAALDERTVIEQAKGVLSYLHGVDMETAYSLLLERSRSTGTLLATTAHDVVDQAANRRP